MARVMEITTPLGADVLLFHTLRGREELSRVGGYEIDLLSLKDYIDPGQILGKSVTLTVDTDGEPRYFNGYVTRFSQGGRYGSYRQYHATVHPWIWFMSRTADCRIFQEMTVPDIVKKVFADHPTSKFKDELTGSYRTWTYRVQYRETDLSFVCRLLEEEGIYFYFLHEDGKHTLVLADSYSAHTEIPGSPLPFIAPDDISRGDIEHITAWNPAREIQPAAYSHEDYDFERPSVDLRTQKVVSPSVLPASYEVYDYPGEYLQKGDGEASVAVRIDEHIAQFETAEGGTNAKTMQAGGLFKLEDWPRSGEKSEHLVVSASYELEFNDYESMDRRGSKYQCRFVAIPSKQQFRPRRLTPKPFVQGPQTAVVVGPGGDEIYTDKYGRVKVLFHWDRAGKKTRDENCSCWIRVSQPWAGKAWGGVTIPRIGQEVIVDFLEGDPDEPIITGRVYNAEQMPPYALPANMTQSGLKSRSSKGGGPDNFNEIRFEDLKGSEQVFIHAEKNQDIEVENDETHWVGHDRSKKVDHDEKIVIGHDRTMNVKHDKSEQIDNNKTIVVAKSHTESIGTAMSVSVGGSLTETVAVNYAESVGAAMELTVGGVLAITVGAAMSESVGGAKVETIGAAKSENIGGSRTLQVGGDASDTIGKNRTQKVTKDDKATIGGQNKIAVTKEYILNAKQIQLVGEDEIHLKCGSAEVLLKKNGDITIKGNKINIKGSGDVIIKGSKIAEN